MQTRDLLVKCLLILSLLFSPVLFAQEHAHHQSGEESREELTETVERAVRITDKKLEVTPSVCPEPGDRAFVNFDPKHLKDPPGFHGMLFFGQGDTFYISHLPMFHKPHDYQAIVEVRLKPDVKAKYQAALAKSGGYFTFAPEGNFSLPDQLVGKKPITGSLVQGHFERGGNELLTTDLELVRVVFYKKLNAKDQKPPKEKYVIFGKGDEYFMAHEIFQRPNVDEIIPLPKDYPLSPEMKKDIQANGLVFTDEIEVKDGRVTQRSDATPGVRGAGIKAIKVQGKEFQYKEFYRETGDLE
jgi:hypothetical protein